MSAALLVAVTAWPAIAQAQAPPEPAEYSLRTYDVGDLVLNVPDYPYQADQGSSNFMGRTVVPAGGGGGFGGGGGGFGGGGGGGVGRVSMQTGDGRGATSDPARITMDDILRVVVSVVSPSEWSDNGGEGEIQRLGTSLIVWQTADVHEHVSGLLRQLRAESGERKTVSIDARWLLLNSDELDELLLNLAGPAEVDRQVLDTYTRRPSNIRGVTNCFSGQLVYLVGGTRRNFVRSHIPVVGSVDRGDDAGQFASVRGRAQGGPRFILAQHQSGGGFGGGFAQGLGRSVGYQPIIEKTNFGALLQIRPTVMKGGQEAIVNVISTVTAPSEAWDNLGDAAGGGSPAPMVDRVAIEVQELATTFRLPLGKPVLVGGLTYQPRAAWSGGKPQGAPGAPPGPSAENSQLYLFLELR